MKKSVLILIVFILITASIGKSDKKHVIDATKTICKDMCK
jgi:hypothetical protein